MEPIEATPALPDAEEVLTAAQLASWRERGFALVDGVLPTELCDRLEAYALERCPEVGSEAAAAVTNFGGGRFRFPSTCDALNEATLHPRLLRAMAQLLGIAVHELRLTQSEVWPKYGRSRTSDDPFDNDDQRIHVDYPNHTLLHPPPWDRPEAIEAILYLSDSADCGGETRVVPREGPSDPAYAWPIVASPGIGAQPWINDRELAEAALSRDAPELAEFRATHLYSRERAVRFRRGTLLLYRHDTWHRGAPLRPNTLRIAQNLSFRSVHADWMSSLHAAWAWAMYQPGQPMERLVARASVDQRCVLGFPPPGHRYWTRETIDAVTQRYAAFGFDSEPYLFALD